MPSNSSREQAAPDPVVELRSRIMKARQSYYWGGTSKLTDAEYDALEDQLRKLAPQDPLLAEVGAPIPAESLLTKAKHRLPMGSQNKVNSQQEFATWFEKHAAGGGVHASLKGDGASAAAYYEAGRLRQVISRGDGVVGEDITANAIRFQGLPAWAEDAEGPFTGAVRFEVILQLSDWAKIDPAKAKNPRNAGAGIMGRKNGEQTQLLSAFAFGMEEPGRASPLATESQKIQRLSRLGFQVIPNRFCASVADAIAYFEEIRGTRESLPFWIDGVVFKVEDLTHQLSLGETANRPKGQVAWKFDSQGAETTVLGYSLSVGHTGAVVPTAELSPVEIGGTTVSSALLNNWDEIARLDVAVGDKVWLIKANDIIPKVIEVLERPESRKPIAEPTLCPACGEPLSRRKNSGGESGAIIECSSDDCSAKAIGKLKRWVKALDIQGVGEVVLQAMIRDLGVEDASGLYRLKQQPEAFAEVLINPEKRLRLGVKRAQSILEQIDQRKKLTLVEFLGSLGVERLGQRRVELMQAQAKGALNQLSDWRSGKLRDPDFAASVGVPTVGALLQDSIDGQNAVIDGLLAAGVEVIEGAAVELTPRPEWSVCITGKLPSGRAKGDYAEALLKIGAQLVDSLTKDTSALVVADPDSQSQKLQKARKLGVPLLSEPQLVAWLESGVFPAAAARIGNSS